MITQRPIFRNGFGLLRRGTRYRHRKPVTCIRGREGAATLSAIFAVLDKIPRSARVPIVRALVFGLIGFHARLRIEGAENIGSEPVLYICNHLSNVDALILSRALRKNPPVFLAGIKLKGTTLTRLVLDLVDVVMIEPNTPDIDAVRSAIDTLKTGRSVLIFPEGGRSRTHSLIRAKAGASLIARRGGACIQPLALMGTEKLFPIDDENMGGERLRHADVTLKIGKRHEAERFVVRASVGKEDRQATADMMMRSIASMLEPSYRGVYADIDEVLENDPKEKVL